MKKILVVIQLAIFLFLLSGCKNETTKEMETLFIEPELFRYEETKDAKGIVVDENGLLYTVKNLEEDKVIDNKMQRFCMYDLDGSCLQQVDIRLGSGTIYTMLIEDNTLYCVAYKRKQGPTLYSIDLTTWETTEIITIKECSSIERLILIEDYFYFCGSSNLDEVNDKTYNLHPEVDSFYYSGEVIGRVSKIEKEPQVEYLSIDFPIDIFKTEEDTLIIYEYTEENGFGFLELNPKEETLQEIGWKKSKSPLQGLIGCENGFLFLKNGMLYYGTVDGIEAQIAMDRSLVGTSVGYRKGFIFYYDFLENMVERVCITDVLKENREIRLLINVLDTTNIYGCGYQMKREEVNMDTFSLKVLAQDTDFDLYLLDSGHPNSYNIKKNGVFYPLNEVAGVQEYLDACFPYLKEIATNEDGDIWMIPIQLSIPGLFYDKQYCMAQGIDFSAMNYREFMAFTQKAELETLEKITNVKTIVEFFKQYLSVEDSFDTELFRMNAKQLKSLYQTVGRYITASIMPIRKDGVVQGELPEFFYEYEYSRSNLLRYAENVEQLGDLENVGMMAVPKVSKEVKNVGTCTFFAVNPQSDNLEATLSYLSTLCTYLMTQQDSFLLSDESMYSNNSLIKEYYKLHEDGAIYFQMDEEVYSNVFDDYLEGKIELEDMITEIERKREIYTKE